MTNLLFPDRTTVSKTKMKMISLWSNNLRPCWSVDLLSHEEFLHHHEEEKDVQSGEIHLPHQIKMRQEPRMSDLKKFRDWAKHMVKLFKAIMDKLLVCATWRTLNSNTTARLLHSSRREQLTWTFLAMLLTFTSMWWRHAHLAIRQHRDLTNHASADRNTIIWRAHLFGTRVDKIEEQTLGIFDFWDGTTSHLTAYPCKGTSPSEVISKLHDWVDNFQMNPTAICANMAFHHIHDMQTFDRMHIVIRFRGGPHNLWRNRAHTGVRLFKNFLSALADTTSE